MTSDAATQRLHVEFEGDEECPVAFGGDPTIVLFFADRDFEDAADQRELDRAWQDAAPLAECCRAIIAAIAGGDEELDGLIEGYEELAPRLTELAEMCDWAAAAESRVRLSFDLRTSED